MASIFASCSIRSLPYTYGDAVHGTDSFVGKAKVRARERINACQHLSLYSGKFSSLTHVLTFAFSGIFIATRRSTVVSVASHTTAVAPVPTRT